MAAEEAPKTRSMQDENELEEGEIDESSSASSKISKPPSHPLEHSWTFWFDSQSAKPGKSKQEDWGSSIRPIYTFATVEEFWGVYNNIRQPSKLTPGTDFHCFKNKIEPKWEDPVCANGGKWTLTFPRGKCDHFWLHTLLALIGDQFDHGDEICGAVVNVRKSQEKISIWTKNAANEAAQVSIGKQWKSFVDSNETIGFIVHDDARRHERSAKNKYTV